MNLLPCPFCGKHTQGRDGDIGEDTLYPSGIGWVYNEEIGCRTYHRGLQVPEDQYCWRVNCAVTYGGCGATMTGDSKEEAINNWNRRVSVS